MGLYLLRQLHHWFSLAVFWSYLAAFALAFAMVVIFFPVGALALLFIGIFLLPVVVFISLTLTAWERAWSRRWLRAERCPSCRADGSIHRWPSPSASVRTTAAGAPDGARDAADDPSLRNPDETPSYECGRCGALFAASGEAVEAPLAAA